MREATAHVRWGIFCAIAAHTLWGLFPLYWRMLGDVPSVELVSHRIVWSCVLLMIVVPVVIRRGMLGGVAPLIAALRNPRAWGIYAVAGAMIGINWLAFIWAVNHDRVLEASLGYYINPLLNVLMGVVLLGERLRTVQWAAVSLAALGVAVMAVGAGGLPWVSLAMASSFSVYGLVKKKAPLPGLVGLMFEMLVLVLPALAYLAFVEVDSEGALGRNGRWVDLLLVAGGVVTVLPLALFATAARRVSLSTIGLLQYVGPTLQFFVGAVVFAEPLGAGRLVGFGFVWAGLLLYLSSSGRQPSATAQAAVTPAAEPSLPTRRRSRIDRQPLPVGNCGK